jgi:hypothetical protein
VITGSRYVLRGQPVTATCAFNARRNPDLPRLRALMPLVRLKAHGPRNVEIEFPDGTRQVRPFRGLLKPRDTTTTDRKERSL